MKIDFCTIASANYLPRIRILQKSLATYAPTVTLHVLLCEWPDIVEQLSAQADFKFLAPNAVCAEWQTLAFQYEITEFNTALKPYLLEYLLNQHCDGAIYLDPDIEIFSSVDSIVSLLTEHDLVLTPHVCKPLAMDGHKPGIDDTLRAGLYNLGFIGISGRPEARQALKWWKEVCRDYCLFDTEHRFFVDQFWAAALPAFIQKFYCLRDPGCNVAYWNIFQRPLANTANSWVVDEKPLIFFHFSGLPKDIQLVSNHQDRIVAPLASPLHLLLSRYRNKIQSNDWSKFSTTPYSFSTYLNGLPILTTERHAFQSLSASERLTIGIPFENHEILRLLASQIFQKPQLSWTRKYFRALALHGFLIGNGKTIAHLFALILQRINRSGKFL
jgi:hypothetical protein